MRKASLLSAFFFASSLFAQSLTIGELVPNWNHGLTRGSGETAPRSYIDFAHPATADGSVNQVSVMWGGSCTTGAFKIVFVRTSSTASASVVAQRGPFNAVSGRNEITLTPPVSVHAGDKIAIVQLQPGLTCGMPPLASDTSGMLVLTDTDISGGSFGSYPYIDVGESMGAIAYSVDPVLVRVVPGVGAAQGVTAFFRTAVQLANLDYGKLTGKLVFHKAGQPAGSNDPSLDFTLDGGQVLSYDDVVTAMGSSGLGSLDVLVHGGVSPLVTTRVFSDGGSAGTSGFIEDGFSPHEALTGYRAGCLVFPADFTNFRMNIGVRTLDTGATLKVTWSSGSTTPLILTYPPNYFEQKTLNQFTGATTLPANGYIWITVSQGSAFVYGTITDNRTSDSAIRMAKAE